MKVKVVIHEETEGGYWAEVPAIPGCATQGDKTAVPPTRSFFRPG